MALINANTPHSKPLLRKGAYFCAATGYEFDSAKDADWFSKRYKLAWGEK